MNSGALSTNIANPLRQSFVEQNIAGQQHNALATNYNLSYGLRVSAFAAEHLKSEQDSFKKLREHFLNQPREEQARLNISLTNSRRKIQALQVEVDKLVHDALHNHARPAVGLLAQPIYRCMKENLTRLGADAQAEPTLIDDESGSDGTLSIQPNRDDEGRPREQPHLGEHASGDEFLDIAEQIRITKYQLAVRQESLDRFRQEYARDLSAHLMGSPWSSPERLDRLRANAGKSAFAEDEQQALQHVTEAEALLALLQAQIQTIISSRGPALTETTFADNISDFNSGSAPQRFKEIARTCLDPATIRLWQSQIARKADPTQGHLDIPVSRPSSNASVPDIPHHRIEWRDNGEDETPKGLARKKKWTEKAKELKIFDSWHEVVLHEEDDITRAINAEAVWHEPSVMA